MKKVKIRISKTNENSCLPIYATPSSSGADVVCVEDVTILPGERMMIHTGLRMELPDGVECQVRPRSGLAIKRGITVLNSPGTIDADYRGECNVILINTSKEPYTFNKGDRVAQFVFMENVVQAQFVEVDSVIDDTERGISGFGSTGK